MQGVVKASKNQSRIRTFFINGALITVCSITLRAIAVAFNVYVANAAGAEAVGLYTLLGGVYGFALTLALSGINLALVRLVSEALALGDGNRARGVVRRAALLSIFFGLLSAVLLFFLADPLSAVWLCEPRAAKPLKILAVCLPATALSSVFNGYFTAVRRAYKSAAANLIEMLSRIGFTVFLFSRIADKNAELACIALVFGSAFAEFCSFFVNAVFYAFDKLRHKFPTLKKRADGSGISKAILSISMPVALTSYVRSALLSVEHSLIPKGLRKYGSNKTDALSSYGALTGMALPVINFPYALIGSFTSLLVPEVAESRAKGAQNHVRYITYRTYQTCLSFAFCVGGVFFAFALRLGELLYSSGEAARYIRLLSLLVPIMYADTSTDAILKGLGEQVHCMKVNIADAILSVMLVSLLVPRYGIVGYVVTIYVAEIVNASLSIGRLIKITKFKFPIKKMILSPLISAIGAGAISNLILRAVNMPLSIFSTIIAISIFVLLYFMLISATGGADGEDLAWISSVFKTKSSE